MKKAAEYILAIAGFFAIIEQYALMRGNSGLPADVATIRFFSYFTILTNLLVAIRFSVLAIRYAGGRIVFFERPSVQTALTVYILVVGIVYNLVLRFLWAPQGMQKVVDEILHTVIPIASVLYWWIFVPKESLKYRDCLLYLWFPLAYIVLILVEGAVTGFYPYPFIDVNRLGYPRTLLNGLGLMMIFIGISLFLTAVSQWLRQNKQNKKT